MSSAHVDYLLHLFYFNLLLDVFKNVSNQYLKFNLSKQHPGYLFNHKLFKNDINLLPHYSISYFSDWQKMYGEELYDHSIDRDENMNLAYRQGFEDIKNKLKQQLMKKFPKKIQAGLHRLNVKIH